MNESNDRLGSPCVVVLATPAPVTHRTAEENLGIGYLAAVLRNHGVTVVVIDGWLEGLSTEQLASRISRHDPDLIGFSCYRTNMERAMETIRLVRDSGSTAFSVAGGYGPTFHAEEFVRAGFDAAVRGEGEIPLLQLIAHVRSGTPSLAAIPGLTHRNGDDVVHNAAPAPKLPMDELPHPQRDTLSLTIARRSLVHVQSARGCQASCTFCSIVAFERIAPGPTWRQRTIENFVDEVENLWRRGATHFKVIDDSFIEPPRDAEWCTDLADEIERRGISPRFRGSIRADRASDGVLRELARAGFFSFSCGIENFSASALRRMAKRADVPANCRALNAMKRYGLYVQAGHILFDDGTTVAELQDNYLLMRRYNWTISKGIFTEMYAAAGTNFTRKLRKTGELIDADSLGNSRYAVRDRTARAVYSALKKWHSHHSAVYDKAIDPLSAPKTLAADELDTFHRISVQLRDKDLDFFGAVLDIVAQDISIKTIEQEVDELLDQQLRVSDDWYAAFEREVEAAYAHAGLVYDADPNPFLC
ncbi:B12-binding domain-containing radical SAM protein [Nocardia abscessus]|uniref:B12-binding domain-containing radical SAM protein n=1 Tax=Nocardia abscessus TaxID=120957 RepID=UPI00313B4799